jgi:hypothetical protein
MCGGHVLVAGRVFATVKVSTVTCNSSMVVENFDGSTSNAKLYFLAYKIVWAAVPMPFELYVVIDADTGFTYFGVFERPVRKGFEGRFVDLFKGRFA